MSPFWAIHFLWGFPVEELYGRNILYYYLPRSHTHHKQRLVPFFFFLLVFMIDTIKSLPARSTYIYMQSVASFTIYFLTLFFLRSTKGKMFHGSFCYVATSVRGSFELLAGEYKTFPGISPFFLLLYTIRACEFCVCAFSFVLIIYLSLSCDFCPLRIIIIRESHQLCNFSPSFFFFPIYLLFHSQQRK